MEANWTKKVILILLAIIFLALIIFIFFNFLKVDTAKIDKTNIEKILSVNKVYKLSDLQIDKSYITSDSLDDEAIKDFLQLKHGNNSIYMYQYKDNKYAQTKYEYHKEKYSKNYDVVEKKYCSIYETIVDESKKYFYTDYINEVDLDHKFYPSGRKNGNVVILSGDFIIKAVDIVDESNKNNMNELLEYIISILPSS